MKNLKNVFWLFFIVLNLLVKCVFILLLVDLMKLVIKLKIGINNN